jgi:hypothetical protein
MTPTNDQLEAVRIALGIGLGLSNVAVWWGVYLERDNFPKDIQDRGWRILVRALAAEAALAFALLAVDTTLGVRQRAQIAALVTPRMVDAAQASVIKTIVVPGVRVVVRSFGGKEPMEFAESLRSALGAAGADVSPPRETIIPAPIQPDGLTVSYARSNALSATVFRALECAGLQPRGGDKSSDDAVVDVGVGPKLLSGAPPIPDARACDGSPAAPAAKRKRSRTWGKFLSTPGCP